VANHVENNHQYSSKKRGFSFLGLLFAVFLIGVGSLSTPRTSRARSQCPEGMAEVGERFCIDRYEAGLVEMLPDGREQPWSPYHSPEGVSVRAVSRPGIVPQGYISARQAQQACRASGKRLCRTDEWTVACMGSQRTTFPYGSRHDATRCNEHQSRSAVEQLFGFGSVWDSLHMNDPRLNQVPGSVSLTGAFQECRSDYGAYDMIGNLYEWTDDPNGTFRGGFYMTRIHEGNGCWYTADVHSGGYHDYSTGFRCCADLPGN